MQALTTKTVYTQDGNKTISVHVCDIRNIDVDIDVMTVSSFYRDYNNTKGTLFEALNDKNIDVSALAKSPEIDLRNQCNIWLSKRTSSSAKLPIKRVGCIEMSSYSADRSSWRKQEETMLASIQSYFRMLDIASIMGISVERIALPILGSGKQKISADFIRTPMLNECIRFLKNNSSVKQIMIVTNNQSMAFKFAMTLEQSYSFQNEMSLGNTMETAGKRKHLAFISYSSKDKNVADNLCSKLEARGIKVWYAPRDIVSGDYASSIVDAVNRCTEFIVIISQNSINSDHVLNEIDLAFSQLKNGVRILPLKIDEEELRPAFLYYLSRQHWMDAHVPPIERRLEEFVEHCSNSN